MSDVPLIAAIYRSMVVEFEACRVKAASGLAGCRKARAKMIRLRTGILRLEIGA
jgi:hypothetical protein